MPFTTTVGERYPYECAEQISSRMMAIASLKDVLSAFNAEGLPSAEKMLLTVALDLTKLKGMQNYDGGFAFWRRGQSPGPTSPSTSPTP